MDGFQLYEEAREEARRIRERGTIIGLKNSIRYVFKRIYPHLELRDIQVIERTGMVPSIHVRVLLPWVLVWLWPLPGWKSKFLEELGAVVKMEKPAAVASSCSVGWLRK
jgi:hypothetical protein